MRLRVTPNRYRGHRASLRVMSPANLGANSGNIPYSVASNGTLFSKFEIMPAIHADRCPMSSCNSRSKWRTVVSCIDEIGVPINFEDRSGEIAGYKMNGNFLLTSGSVGERRRFNNRSRSNRTEKPKEGPSVHRLILAS